MNLLESRLVNQGGDLSKVAADGYESIAESLQPARCRLQGAIIPIDPQHAGAAIQTPFGVTAAA
jgi:hypothetical protein